MVNIQRFGDLGLGKEMGNTTLWHRNIEKTENIEEWEPEPRDVS